MLRYRFECATSNAGQADRVRRISLARQRFVRLSNGLSEFFGVGKPGRFRNDLVEFARLWVDSLEFLDGDTQGGRFGLTSGNVCP